MKIKNILFILLAIFAFSACSDDTEPRIALDGSITLEPINVEALEITDENLKETVLSFKWTAEVEGNVDIVSRYAIQIDLAGGDFSNGKLFGESAERSVSVDGEELNNILTKSLNQAPFVAVYYDVRVVAVAKNIGGALIVVPGAPASAPQKIQIIATRPTPDELFMIGTKPFGDWDWSSKKIVTMTPVNGNAGEFWAVKYLTKADQFQWAPAKESKDAFGKLEQVIGYSVGDDNRAAVESDGLYMIYISYKRGSVTIEPAKINGIGNCFGGWSEGNALFTIEGNLAKITTKAPGELRISASSTAQISDWWTREFILRAGVIEYRGNGGDQEPRIEVEAGKVITLNFNENTGTIE